MQGILPFFFLFVGLFSPPPPSQVWFRVGFWSRGSLAGPVMSRILFILNAITPSSLLECWSVHLREVSASLLWLTIFFDSCQYDKGMANLVIERIPFKILVWVIKTNELELSLFVQALQAIYLLIVHCQWILKLLCILLQTKSYLMWLCKVAKKVNRSSEIVVFNKQLSLIGHLCIIRCRSHCERADSWLLFAWNNYKFCKGASIIDIPTVWSFCLSFYYSENIQNRWEMSRGGECVETDIGPNRTDRNLASHKINITETLHQKWSKTNILCNFTGFLVYSVCWHVAVFFFKLIYKHSTSFTTHHYSYCFIV